MKMSMEAFFSSIFMIENNWTSQFKQVKDLKAKGTVHILVKTIMSAVDEETCELESIQLIRFVKMVGSANLKIRNVEDGLVGG